MRYCSRCGNALSVGASFCHCCGAELKNLVPEVEETPVAAPAIEPVVEVAAEPVAEPVVEPVVEEPAAEETAPVVIPQHNPEELKEEKEFLDMTHRLLRWERKAWSISGKFYLIMGIVFAAYFGLFGLIFTITGFATDTVEAAVIGLVIAIAYGWIIGGLFIATGIICRTLVKKIPQYTDTLYKNFSATHKRCNSVGMIVLCAIVNTIPLPFYLINFIRMKRNQELADRILTRQGVK